MDTNNITGKQTISNNTEYYKYTLLEKDLNKVIETLEFDIYTPVTVELLQGLKDFELIIFNMRAEYDKQRVKMLSLKKKQLEKQN